VLEGVRDVVDALGEEAEGGAGRRRSATIGFWRTIVVSIL
jgi:hypothetical protein